MLDPALSIVVGHAGKIKRLAPKTYTYSVRRFGWPSESFYRSVVKDFGTAVREINDLNIGLSFEQVNYGPTAGDFQLAYGDDEEWAREGEDEDGMRWLEVAFFPWSPPEHRIVHIFKLAHDLYPEPGQKVGICRHALGHILGLWHEFEEPQDRCGQLMLSGVVLGCRNPKSIMEYNDALTKSPRDWASAEYDSEDKIQIRDLYDYTITVRVIDGKEWRVENVSLSREPGKRSSAGYRRRSAG